MTINTFDWKPVKWYACQFNRTGGGAEKTGWGAENFFLPRAQKCLDTPLVATIGSVSTTGAFTLLQTPKNAVKFYPKFSLKNFPARFGSLTAKLFIRRKSVDPAVYFENNFVIVSMPTLWMGCAPGKLGYLLPRLLKWISKPPDDKVYF